MDHENKKGLRESSPPMPTYYKWHLSDDTERRVIAGRIYLHPFILLHFLRGWCENDTLTKTYHNKPYAVVTSIFLPVLLYSRPGNIGPRRSSCFHDINIYGSPD
jgi:hypothetical protein